jgi:hypothetical protein
MATRARRAAARFLALFGASTLQLNPLQHKKDTDDESLL